MNLSAVPKASDSDASWSFTPALRTSSADSSATTLKLRELDGISRHLGAGLVELETLPVAAIETVGRLLHISGTDLARIICMSEHDGERCAVNDEVLEPLLADAVLRVARVLGTARHVFGGSEGCALAEFGEPRASGQGCRTYRFGCQRDAHGG